MTTPGVLPQSYTAIVAKEYGRMPELASLPMPVAVAGSAIVKVLAAPCDKGSLGFMEKRVPEFCNEVPFIPGVAAVGRIVSVGADATILRSGQLVLLEPFVHARDDPSKQIIKALFSGSTEETQALAAPGLWRDGFWAEYVHVALENCFPLNEQLLLGSKVDGGLGYKIEDLPHLNPLLVAYGGLSSVNLKAGETVLVAPATGWYGGAAVEVASAMGARVIAAGRNQDVLDRLKQSVPRVHTVQLAGNIKKDPEILAQFGPINVLIDWTPAGTEKPLYLASSMPALAYGGRVVVMGQAYGDLAVNCGLLVMKNATIQGRYMYEKGDIPAVVKLVDTGLLKLGKQAGHEVLASYKLDQYGDAIAHSASNGYWGKKIVWQFE